MSEFILARVSNEPSLVVRLDQLNLKGKQMRSTFDIELRVDIDQLDDQRRKAYLELVVITAKQYYAQASMIAKGKPLVKVTYTDRMRGEENVPVFDTNEEDVR